MAWDAMERQDVRVEPAAPCGERRSDKAPPRWESNPNPFQGYSMCTPDRSEYVLPAPVLSPPGIWRQGWLCVE